MLCMAVLSASDALAVKVTVTSAEAVAYTSLLVQRGPFTVPSACGCVESLAPPEGSVFVHVSAQLRVEFDAQTQMYAVPAAKIGLFDGQTRYGPAGLMQTLPFLDGSVGGADIFRTADWQKGPVPAFFKAVFVVPKDKRNLILKFDDAECAVAIPAEATTFDVKNFFEIRMVSARLLDEVRDQDKDKDKGNLGVLVTNPGGKILELKIVLTIKVANSQSGRSFQWSPLHFSLNYAKGDHAMAIGVPWFGSVNQSVPSSGLVNGSRLTMDQTIYYPVPASLTEFDVCYLNTPVAKAVVGK